MTAACVRHRKKIVSKVHIFNFPESLQKRVQKLCARDRRTVNVMHVIAFRPIAGAARGLVQMMI